MEELIELMKKKLASSDEKLTKLEIIMITYLLRVDTNIKKLIEETSQNSRFLKILEEETRPSDEVIADVPIPYDVYREICEDCDLDSITFMGVA
jgi:hypothetical protein